MISEILKSSLRPVNILFPLPIVPLAIGVYTGDIKEFWKPVALTFLFYPAVNLWNHINDADDDYRSGKETPFISRNNKLIGAILVLVFYISSFLFVIFNAKNEYSVILFLLVSIFVFLYSDNMVTKIRLKRHYIGEIIVYSLSLPAYLLLLYSVVRDIDIVGLKLLILFFPLLFSGLFIKDLKDITADKSAGLVTLGVRFDPIVLIKVFYSMVIMYYILGFIFYFKSLLALAFILLIVVLYCLFKIKRNEWLIDTATIKYYKLTIYSGIFSLLLFISFKITLVLMQ